MDYIIIIPPILKISCNHLITRVWQGTTETVLGLDVPKTVIQVRVSYTLVENMVRWLNVLD